MAAEKGIEPSKIDRDNLPQNFPTHDHGPAFWEALGRVVASFGFLEETLGRAVYALTATREYRPDQVEAAYEKWLGELQCALKEPLGPMIKSYGKALRAHQGATEADQIDHLINELEKASQWRNILCHASWSRPDGTGKSRPRFVNRRLEIFDGTLGINDLGKIQQEVAQLVCDVIDSVSRKGIRFPGAKG